jgi:MSHA biogenesis protein MshN
MSVINRVLKDLDQQARPPSLAHPSIRSVGANPSSGIAGSVISRSPRVAGVLAAVVLALIAVLVTVAWWLWPARLATPPQASDAAQMPNAASTPPADTAAPKLQLSHELSTLPAAPSTATPTTAASATTSITTSTNAPKTAAAVTPQPAPVAIRLATQLEPRRVTASTASTAAPPAPSPTGEAATTKPQVIKEARPQSNAEQAESLWQRNQARSSQGTLEQVLQLDPGHLRARQALVVLALEQARQDVAESLLRDGLSLHPGEFWFPRSLAQLHLQRGQDAEAAAYLRRSLGKQAASSDWALYASTLVKLGRHEDAANAYREALRRDGNQGTWWIGLGVALERSGQKRDAAEAYARATHTRLSDDLKTFATQKAQDLR